MLAPSALRLLVQNFADPMIGLVTNCAVILNQDATGVVAVAQASFYFTSVTGMLFGARRFRLPLSVAHSFCLVNPAALLGTLHCISLRTTGQWKTVR
jgi:hypothetical protein